MGYRNNESNPRRDFGRRRGSSAGRRESEFTGDDYYYGGPRSEREEWESRSFDNNPNDRREGMYDAGGRDFAERARDAYGFGTGAENDWYARRNRAPTWTGGDHAWSERQHAGHGHGFMESLKNFFGVGPKGYKRSDERIREDVCEALARHPDVDASDIEVDVKDGHVTLTGTVANRWMRRQAEDALEYINGVEDVDVNLRVPRAGVSTDSGMPEIGRVRPNPPSAPGAKNKGGRSKIQ